METDGGPAQQATRARKDAALQLQLAGREESSSEATGPEPRSTDVPCGHLGAHT